MWATVEGTEGRTRRAEPARPGLAGLAAALADRERAALLAPAGEAGERLREEAAGARLLLEAAAGAALSAGASVWDLRAAVMASSDARGRMGASGAVAVACARLADVEDLMLDEGGALGGEVPAARTAELAHVLGRERAKLFAAVRAALVRGVPPSAILETAAAAGLDLEEGDLALAFERHR
ncbi:hypothetical protein [Miltoncostaea marina]|uniref:hypothetical protein n=1 Tax=Miltoncostaea marina TaxID=2843215 RepID=UPI001C3D6764|nr:hypothetical protein [Miltoncostaea marina]